MSNDGVNAGQAGFILIYVAGLLAAIALILLEIGSAQTPAPLFAEKQFNHQLQNRQEQILLDFITVGTQQQQLQNDPRLAQYKRILAANPNLQDGMQEELDWLKNALSQLNFKIDISGKDQTKDDGGKTEQDKPGAAAAQAAPETLFTARKLPYIFKIGNAEYTVRILPSNALPNLNSIPFDALWRYLQLLKMPENEAKELAAALIDWRDEDGFRTENIGAESEYYYGMRPPYSPPDAPIRTWQELNYVRGMDAERVRLLRENFMLGRPDATGVSPEYASPETFAALTGLKLEIVRNIMREYGNLGERNTSVGTILLSQDATTFETAASWAPDPNLLRIVITAPDSILTADYDPVNKRLINWW